LPSAHDFNNALVACLLASICFASLFGGKVERSGAAILFGGLVATWATQVVVGNAVTPLVLVDLGVAIAFGILAVHQPDKLWPGSAGTAQFAAFTFSASRAISFPLTDNAYVIATNLSGMGVVAALAIGTYRHRWCAPTRSEWDELDLTLQQRGAAPALR